MKEKHLEFLQNIIDRLSNHSFLIKGWTVSLLTGLYALAQFQSDQDFVIISYYPIIIFWLIDAYYLHLERIFRDLYDKVANDGIDNYTIDKSDSDLNTFPEYFKSIFSVSIWPLYLTSFLVTIAIVQM